MIHPEFTIRLHGYFTHEFGLLHISATSSGTTVIPFQTTFGKQLLGQNDKCKTLG
jgi:hypothetical protein